MQYKEIFIKVIINTLKELMKVEFQFEELTPSPKYSAAKEITSQISIFGPEHEGMIILNLDREIVRFLYSKSVVEDVEDDDYVIEDFCGELTNIVSGKFIEFLDIDINISLPMINFDHIEYSTLRKNNFDAFRFYDNLGHDIYIYTYMSTLSKGF